jgi:hypothetical protein
MTERASRSRSASVDHGDTRFSPRVSQPSTRAIESLRSTFDEADVAALAKKAPAKNVTPSLSSSSSSSSSLPPPLDRQTEQVYASSYLLNRIHELERSLAESTSLVKQLRDQSRQPIKSESKESAPLFVPPSTNSGPSSSSSSSGSQSTHRYQQLLTATSTDNQGMLMMAKSETDRLQQLHDPMVLSRLPQQHTPSQHPLLFLPPRMLHPPPSDTPSSAESLLTAFLHERRSGDLIHKKIKSFSEWMRGMEDGMKRARAANNWDAMQQSAKYITLISEYNATYGWAAADCYWYELQKEVEAGYHSMMTGSPWNARAHATMIAKYQPLGRPKQDTSSSTSSSSPSSSSSSSRENRTRNLECSHHGKNSSHSTADCKFLAKQKSSTTKFT